MPRGQPGSAGAAWIVLQVPVMSSPIVLVASGDSRLSANRVCWPAQQALETIVTRAFGELGREVRRAHPIDPIKGHGFIDGQARGIEVFRDIDPDAPLVVATAVWQYTSHVLAGLTKHRGPILTLANWGTGLLLIGRDGRPESMVFRKSRFVFALPTKGRLEAVSGPQIVPTSSE